MSEVQQVGPAALPPVVLAGETWWTNNKKWIIPILISILSALGGGVATSPQTIGNALPDVFGVVGVKKEVEDLKGRVTNIEGILSGQTQGANQGQGGIIQVHP